MQKFTLFAENYSTGSYGSNTYACPNGVTTCAAATGTANGTTTTAAATSSGVLANTGIAVLGFVSLACLVIFAALVVRVWRRPRLAVQPQETDAETIDATGRE